jgi:hypothetical protein
MKRPHPTMMSSGGRNVDHACHATGDISCGHDRRSCWKTSCSSSVVISPSWDDRSGCGSATSGIGSTCFSIARRGHAGGRARQDAVSARIARSDQHHDLRKTLPRIDRAVSQTKPKNESRERLAENSIAALSDGDGFPSTRDKFYLESLDKLGHRSPRARHQLVLTGSETA